MKLKQVINLGSLSFVHSFFLLLLVPCAICTLGEAILLWKIQSPLHDLHVFMTWNYTACMYIMLQIIKLIFKSGDIFNLGWISLCLLTLINHETKLVGRQRKRLQTRFKHFYLILMFILTACTTKLKLKQSWKKCTSCLYSSLAFLDHKFKAFATEVHSKMYSKTGTQHQGIQCFWAVKELSQSLDFENFSHNFSKRWFVIPFNLLHPSSSS